MLNFGTQAGSPLNPGRRPPSPVSKGPDSTPKQGAFPWPSLSRPKASPRLACPLPSRAPRTGSPFQIQRPQQKDPRPLLQPVHCKSRFLYNLDGGGGVEDVGEAKALPEQRQEKASGSQDQKKGGSLFSLPRPLVFVWAGGGGPRSIICPRPPSSRMDPHPRPRLGGCRVSWTGITKGTPPAAPFPVRTQAWGLGSGCPQGSKGPRSLTHRRQRPRPELRAGAATAAAAGSAWCGLMQAAAPSPPVLVLLAFAPPIGGPPFPPSSLLLYS